MATAITLTASPSGVNASSYIATYSSVSIGTASSDRIITVVVGSELSDAIPSACTIDYGSGDTAMTAGSIGNWGQVFARIFYLTVSTGTSATIKVTFSSTNPTSAQNKIAVYSVTGATYLSAGNDGSTDMDETNPLTTGAITIATDGGFLAVASGANGSISKSWTNATRDIDIDTTAFRFTTATRITALSATEIICTGGNNEDGALSYVIFDPIVGGTSIKDLIQSGFIPFNR